MHRAGFAAAHLNLLLKVWHVSPSATCVGTDGAGPGDPLSPPQALGPVFPTKGLVSSWCGSHLRLSKQWILARCAPSTAREDSCTRLGGSEPAGQGVLPRAAWLTSLEHPVGILAGSCFCLNADILLQAFSPAPQWCRAGDGCISCTCAPCQHQSCPAPGTGAQWSLGSSGLPAPELGQPGSREAMIHPRCPAMSPSLGLSLPFVR